MHRRLLALIVLVAISMPIAVWARVHTKNEGTWPKNWPEELEPLRKSAQTISVATGIQQNIYEIRIPDRETFLKVWPAVLKIRTPGSPLSLYRVKTEPPKTWGPFLSNDVPAIRIYAPSRGFSLHERVAITPDTDMRQLVKEGRAIMADAPWPESIVGDNGELPEYVYSEMIDGQLVWVAGDPSKHEQRRPGFFHRARIDIELVVDGDVIDLNAVPLPDGASIMDFRFDEGASE